MAQGVVEGLSAVEIQTVSDKLSAWTVESRGWSPWEMETDTLGEPISSAAPIVNVALRRRGSEEPDYLLGRDEGALYLVDCTDHSSEALSDIEAGLELVRRRYLPH